jgi:hypothetical protein
MGDYLSRDEIVGFETTDVETPKGTILVREIPADVLFKMAQDGAVETYEDEQGVTRSRVHLNQIDLIGVALRCIVDPKTNAPMFKSSERSAVAGAGFGVVSTVAQAALELTGWAVGSTESEQGADPNE